MEPAFWQMRCNIHQTFPETDISHDVKGSTKKRRNSFFLKGEKKDSEINFLFRLICVLYATYVKCKPQ
jgi:hypothetical protein